MTTVHAEALPGDPGRLIARQEPDGAGDVTAHYHYFTSKTDILYEIFAAVVEHISERLCRHPEELAPAERLHLICATCSG